MKRIFAGFLSILLVVISVSSVNAVDYRRLEGPQQWGRSHNFDVQHVKLELSFDEARKIVFGRATTTIQPLTDNFTNFELDAADLAIELVQLRPDVLVVLGDLIVRDVKAVTTTIPVVMLAGEHF